MQKDFDLWDSDNNLFTCFGEQPDLFEVHLGKALMPLLELKSGDEESSLDKELEKSRKKIDAELGLLIPEFNIYEDTALLPNEYAFLFKGTEIAKHTVRLGYYICLDTGNVKTPVNTEGLEFTKEPAFDMDGFFVPEPDWKTYKAAGYVCASPKKIIRVHFYECIRKNRTKILDQCMVNNLVEKVRKVNPDVVSDVFFMHQFSTSDLKLILDRLLDEEVSIRDMNTILETIADYLPEEQKPYELAEKVREHLSYSFIKDYVDDNKTLHCIRVSQDINELLSETAYYPQSRVEVPYCAFDRSQRNRFFRKVSGVFSKMTGKDYQTVIVCVSSVRYLFREAIRREMPGVRVISDMELYALNNDEFHPVVEEELSFEEE